MKFTRKLFSTKSHLKTATETQNFIKQGFLESIFEIEACADKYVQNTQHLTEHSNEALPMNKGIHLLTATFSTHSKMEDLGFYAFNHERIAPQHHGALKHKFQTFHAQEQMKLKHMTHHLYEIQHHRGKKDFDRLCDDVLQLGGVLESHFDAKDAILIPEGSHTTTSVNMVELRKKMLDLFRSTDPNLVNSNVKLARKVLEQVLLLPEDDKTKQNLIKDFRLKVTGDLFQLVITGSKSLESAKFDQ